MKRHLQTVAAAARNRWLILGVMLAMFVAPSFAQTPVPIVVNTNAIFTQTNSWIVIFAPVVAIGAGIAIALAILGFIAGEIIKAFK